MQVSFKLNNLNALNFGKNQKIYNQGYQDGRRDGLIGNDTYLKENIEEVDYKNGYNSGYEKGKEKRTSETKSVTVNDVIQDLVNGGKTRKDAVEFVAQYLGGW